MKILYILVSQPADFFYEQALISIISAKYRMPNVSISLLMDSKTKSGLLGSRSAILDYVDEIIAVDLDESSPFLRSRILKTKMRTLVNGDFLYVDVDTVWTGIIDAKDFTHDVMGVLDGNCELKKHHRRDYIYQQFEKLSYRPVYPDHINGGVLFMKDSLLAKKFCDQWNEFWRVSCGKDICFDQPALHQTIDANKNIFALLPGVYNAQIALSLNYLVNAKLIHYHPYGPYSDKKGYLYQLQGKTFWENVKHQQDLQQIKEIAFRPSKYFNTNFECRTDDDILFKSTRTYNLLRDMFERKMNGKKSRFDLIENIVGKLTSFYSNR